tara:strand:+ start:142 stop:696 length:555 start_codon:yes stop_codon:yes gene_type:complete
MNLASHRRSLPALAGISFLESSIFPIPPDIMLIPMVLANRKKAWKIAFVCTVSSVIGGVLGYLIGYFFHKEIGAPLLEIYNYSEKFSSFTTMHNKWGFWVVLFAGLTPFPYKVITIFSGFASLDLIIFVIASFVARGLRFFLIAGLLWKYGSSIRAFIEAKLGLTLLVFFLLLIASLLAIKIFL